MKLLIIEDSQRLLRSLGSGLRKMGYAVDLAADGVDGLDYGLFNDYDAIVLDLMLPGIDGLTILRKLRAAGETNPHPHPLGERPGRGSHPRPRARGGRLPCETVLVR